jgi:ribosomal RNA-processing protein 9
LSADDSSIYSGSKDNSVIHWDTETGKKKTILRPKWTRATHGEHQASEGEVLCIANTSDGRYIVSSGRDKAVRIYDSRMKYAEIKCLTGHRDTVTCLSFRRDSYSLFSGSMDRCLKHWDLNEMGYLETMFGHQDGVNAMDCWTQERPISASSDRTLRVWKVSDESHLVLRGHKGTIDCVKMMTEDTYLSGGQDGTLNLWKDTQKKPVAYAHAAHGEEIKGSPRWITSVASVKMSDLAASGSYDGYVRLWNVNASENRTLTPHLVLPCDGFVNSLAMSTSLVVAGTGQEHRLGRWWRTKGNINKIVVWRLPEEN